jgi:hypothetical protein
MRERKISSEQVLQALRDWTRTWEAPPSGRPIISQIYVGKVNGRDLRVYVEPASNPVYVTTVAWEGEEEE